MVKVACCRHCGKINSVEELFDDFEPLPDCIKAVAGFGESRRLAIRLVHSNHPTILMCIVLVQLDMVCLQII